MKKFTITQQTALHANIIFQNVLYIIVCKSIVQGNCKHLLINSPLFVYRVFGCLKKCEIDKKVFTITLDNAYANDNM